MHTRPPLCHVCHRSFSNVWELNKHAEICCTNSVSFQGCSPLIYRRQKSVDFSKEVTVQPNTASVLYDSAMDLKSDQNGEIKFEIPEMSENSIEYILGEDDRNTSMESDCERDDYSESSDSSNSSDSEAAPTPNTSDSGVTCDKCGRGPFRAIKLHLLHCSGVWLNKYQCILCKKLFPTEAALKKHHMPLNSCDICSQVFTNENSFYSHQCPKGFKLPLVLFCSESMPKACNICKLFFTSEKSLSLHVTKVHSSVVNTKVCVITDPSQLTGKTVVQALYSTQVKTVIAPPGILNQAINGKLRVGQYYVASLPGVVKSSSSSLSASSQSGMPPVLAHMASTAAHVNKPSSHLPTPSPAAPAATDPPLETPDSSSSTTPTIMALFENHSQSIALMKRMNTGWRAKTPCHCRHCGAIFRQQSLVISHRYLHRGRRLHQCQCGRAFKHKLHLLRHCVQHAEATSYICVSCGDTFTGAQLLAQHLKGKSHKNSTSGRTKKVKKRCRMPFTCDCGQLFFRPSAYIWHQLKNR
ncbi:zinc finger protein 135 [Melanotaenia boesemani]|uniref:zinc finger protein 135 n=1 Tax=Melanotaenia boesemani TaxID=1250792 RepID=UPI001C054EFD|nr:zinc finger protein 135 [Melanotaenia boesemani]XP_041844235.1 zinc finger protein 135 [Melanotaenia boesemani]